MAQAKQQAQEVVVSVEEVAAYFAELEDPRSEVNLRHPLVSVVTISVMAVLAGADGPTAIRRWAKLKSEFLKRVLPLPYGIPSKDVFGRVLAALDPQAFQAGFGAWLAALRAKAEGESEGPRPTFQIDGKTLRRSHDRKHGLGPLHSVSLWAADYGLSLGQVACAEKSNEITAIPELLKLVDTRGAIITIDAMGTQTAIAEQIIAGGADYVLALKGNQETLHDGVIEYLDEQIEEDFVNCEARRHTTRETAHGREETRHYVQLPAPPSWPGFERWAGLKTIGIAILICLRDGKETTQMRYYISSLGLGVKQFARAVRGHWSIENSLHWSLDVTYREDQLRIRHQRLRENFAWLNRFTLSLLKQHPAKMSQAMKRRSCGWSDEFLLQVVTGQGS
jgi:predicted transposase YbfD/YdcC